MKSLDYLKLVGERGMAPTEGCSTILWAHKVSDKNQDEFLKLLKEKSNLPDGELLFLVNKLSDVIPADIIEKWIRKLTADPETAMILATLALRWKDNRKKIFFEEFVKTFADNPHYHLSQAMFVDGALNEE